MIKMKRLAKRLAFAPSSALHSHRHPADKWADRGRLRPTFERIELARPFDQIEVGYRVLVVVKIPALGAFSKTWPLDCPKSDKLVRNVAAYLVEFAGKALIKLMDRD